MLDINQLIEIIQFQSTLPRRERRYTWKALAEVEEFQSTLPRRERPQVTTANDNTTYVSIHAPA